MLAGYSGEKVDKTIKKTRYGRLSQDWPGRGDTGVCQRKEKRSLIKSARFGNAEGKGNCDSKVLRLDDAEFFGADGGVT